MCAKHGLTPAKLAAQWDVNAVTQKMFQNPGSYFAAFNKLDEKMSQQAAKKKGTRQAMQRGRESFGKRGPGEDDRAASPKVAGKKKTLMIGSHVWGLRPDGQRDEANYWGSIVKDEPRLHHSQFSGQSVYRFIAPGSEF